MKASRPILNDFVIQSTMKGSIETKRFGKFHSVYTFLSICEVCESHVGTSCAFICKEECLQTTSWRKYKKYCTNQNDHAALVVIYMQTYWEGKYCIDKAKLKTCHIIDVLVSLCWKRSGKTNSRYSFQCYVIIYITRNKFLFLHVHKLFSSNSRSGVLHTVEYLSYS